MRSVPRVPFGIEAVVDQGQEGQKRGEKPSAMFRL